MQIFREVAGYSLGRADIVRRAMSKKKADVMAREREYFLDGMKDENGSTLIEGAVARGADRAAAEALFDRMAAFAKYAFNKSHAAAYAHLSFRTAYLKCHYPGEYLSALLSSVLGNAEKTAEYTAEAARYGIRVLAPDINESDRFFRMTREQSGGNIRFGLVAIKGVGEGFARSILEERARGGRFSSPEDFVERMADKELGKRVMEALIRSGAMDSLGQKRSVLYASYELMIDSCMERLRQNPAGQIDLFSAFSQESAAKPQKPAFAYPDMEEYPLRERLMMERETTGQYFSGHLLDEYANHINAVSPARICDVLAAHRTETDTDPDTAEQPVAGAFADGAALDLAGIVTRRNDKQTRRGEPMAFLTLEDRYGELELIVFPKMLETYGALLHPDAAVAVHGKISVREEEDPKLLVDRVTPLLNKEAFAKRSSAPVQNAPAAKEALPADGATLYLNFPSLGSDCRAYARFLSLMEIFPGSVPVVLHDAATGRYLKSERCGLELSPAVHEALTSILGRENVVLRTKKP